MTNREAHEAAAGIPLDPLFFAVSGIDPDAAADELPAVKPDTIERLECVIIPKIHIKSFKPRYQEINLVADAEPATRIDPARIEYINPSTIRPLTAEEIGE